MFKSTSTEMTEDKPTETKEKLTKSSRDPALHVMRVLVINKQDTVIQFYVIGLFTGIVSVLYLGKRHKTVPS